MTAKNNVIAMTRPEAQVRGVHGVTVDVQHEPDLTRQVEALLRVLGSGGSEKCRQVEGARDGEHK